MEPRPVNKNFSRTKRGRGTGVLVFVEALYHLKHSLYAGAAAKGAYSALLPLLEDDGKKLCSHAAALIPARHSRQTFESAMETERKPGQR